MHILQFVRSDVSDNISVVCNLYHVKEMIQLLALLLKNDLALEYFKTLVG